MLKKLSEKLRAKFPATTPGCFMLKIAHLDDAFSEVFLTASKPSRRSITAAKKKRKGEKGKAKKNPKIKKPKDLGDFLKILISAHARVTMHLNAMLVARKANCCVANAFPD